MPLAVADLEAASERYLHLGFTLKRGRYHEKGIRNRHIKFSDGAEIGLIAASGNRDALTTECLRHLPQGDVPQVVQTGHGSSMFPLPDMTGSIWLEFRETGRRSEN